MGRALKASMNLVICEHKQIYFFVKKYCIIGYLSVKNHALSLN